MPVAKRYTLTFPGGVKLDDVEMTSGLLDHHPDDRRRESGPCMAQIETAAVLEILAMIQAGVLSPKVAADLVRAAARDLNDLERAAYAPEAGR